MRLAESKLIRASAHDMPMIADGSVNMIATSPPYYGLRAYSGEQSIEWPTVDYSPMAGLATLHIQGCEPDCEHEWVASPAIIHHGGQTNLANVIDSRTGRPAGGAKTHKHIKDAIDDNRAGSGRYCIKCGGWRGPLGLEPTVEMYVGHIVLCAREWWRVLRKDSVMFLNLGDSYCGYHGNSKVADVDAPSNKPGYIENMRKSTIGNGLKPKDLMGIPWRCAFALQADGWWLRSDITWVKKAPMPESVTDRPTKATEMVFLFAKSQHYYFDMEAVKEPGVMPFGGKFDGYAPTTKNHHGDQAQSAVRKDRGRMGGGGEAGRNMRNYIILGPEQFTGSHFAVWPKKLVEPMILAGTSAAGCCAKCGAPRERVVERGFTNHSGITKSAYLKGSSANRLALLRQAARANGGEYHANQSTVGWQPTCQCYGHFEKHETAETDDNGEQTTRTHRIYIPDGLQPECVPCVVLDPFSGSGTTGAVAASLGRDYIGVDISSEYIEMADKRVGNTEPALFSFDQ